MLSEADDVALQHGWLHIDETATTGLVSRLDEHVTYALEQEDPRPRRRVTGIALPGNIGITATLTPELSVGLRRKIGALLDRLAERDPNSGLMITVDEVQSGIADLREVAVITQHLIREDRNVALVLAGLPSAVSDLLRNDVDERVMTFLRRADKHVLVDVPVAEVQDAFDETIHAEGRTIDGDALAAAAEATFGYPFLIQLVGYHMWRASDSDNITLADVRVGIDAARRRMGSLVHETALADLSDLDKTFLAAMSRDDGASRMKDIRHRMGDVSPQYANTYRERLLAAQMITQVSFGKVDFALPYLRTYLREHRASYGLLPDGD